MVVAHINLLDPAQFHTVSSQGLNLPESYAYGPDSFKSVTDVLINLLVVYDCLLHMLPVTHKNPVMTQYY